MIKIRKDEEEICIELIDGQLQVELTDYCSMVSIAFILNESEIEQLKEILP